jgi:hypothetical protein
MRVVIGFLLALGVALPAAAGDGWSEYNTCNEAPPAGCVLDSWLRTPTPYELGDLSTVSEWTKIMLADGHDPEALCYYVFAWDTGETPMVRPDIAWPDVYAGTPVVILSKKYPTGVTHKVRAWERGSADCAEKFVFLPVNHCCGQ